MQFPSPVSLQWIAEFINAKLIGNNNKPATGINEIHKVEKGDLVFVDHPKYYDKCLNSDASFIIINKETNVPEEKVNPPGPSTIRLPPGLLLNIRLPLVDNVPFVLKSP